MSKEGTVGGGCLARGPRGPDRPLPRKLTLILKCGHQGAPARRRLRPPPGDTPTGARSSVALSIFSRSLRLALSPSSLFLILLSSLALPSLSLFFLSSRFKDGESGVRNKVTKMPLGLQRGGKIGSALGLNPLLVQRGGGRGRGKSRACLKNLSTLRSIDFGPRHRSHRAGSGPGGPAAPAGWTRGRPPRAPPRSSGRCVLTREGTPEGGVSVRAAASGGGPAGGLTTRRPR